MQGWIKHSHNLLYKWVCFLVFWFFRLLYRHRIYGVDHVPPGGALIVANHVSFYDPPLLSVSTPYEVHFLARKSLFRFFGFGWLIRRLNAHPVTGKAQDVAVLRTIVQLVKQGKKVIIFPEGTRSANGDLQPMKMGVSLLIARTGSVVVPAYLHGMYGIWPSKKRFPKLTGKTACVFGKPLSFPKGVPHEEIAHTVAQEIASLKKWYKEHVDVAKTKKKSKK